MSLRDFFIEKNLTKQQKIFRFAFYLQMLTLFSYAIFGRIFLYFERSVALLLCMMFLAGALELLIQHWRGKKLYFPVSAIIASLGCSIILDSTSWLPYIMAASLAVLSKFFVVKKDGAHIFNPSNFGITAVLLLHPGNLNLWGTIFAGSWIFSVTFFCLGSLIVLLAGQATISFFWILNFAVIALIRAKFEMGVFLPNVKLLASVVMLLFTFNMITDPKTAPQTMKGRFFFTLAIAAIDGLFRVFFIPNGNIYALFIVSAIKPIIYDKK